MWPSEPKRSEILLQSIKDCIVQLISPIPVCRDAKPTPSPPLPFQRKVVKISKLSVSGFPKPWSERIRVIGFVFWFFLDYLF